MCAAAEGWRGILASAALVLAVVGFVAVVLVLVFPVAVVSLGDDYGASVSFMGVSFHIPGTGEFRAYEPGSLLGLLAGVYLGSQVLFVYAVRYGRVWSVLLSALTSLLSSILIIRNSMVIISFIYKSFKIMFSSVTFVGLEHAPANYDIRLVLFAIMGFSVVESIYASLLFLQEESEDTGLLHIASSTGLALALLASVLAPHIVIRIPAPAGAPPVSAEIRGYDTVYVAPPSGGVLHRITLLAKSDDIYFLIYNSTIDTREKISITSPALDWLIRAGKVDEIVVIAYVRFGNIIAEYIRTLKPPGLPRGGRAWVNFTINYTGSLLGIAMDKPGLCQRIIGYNITWLSHNVWEQVATTASCNVTVVGLGGPVRVEVLYEKPSGEMGRSSLVISGRGTYKLTVDLNR